jgi:arabinogalactan endo-1,4-beta-galactosidase
MRTSWTLSLLSLAPATSALQYVGVDWSSVQAEEAAGVTYTTASGQAQPLKQILADSGVNTVRQRVWVNPLNGEYNLNYNIEIAKRAQAAGMDIYIDLHLSDTWADPAHQDIPSGWPTDVENLSWKLYNYTLDVSNALAAEGINPTIISVGNEIRGGLLWPVGHYDNPGNIATLLHSGCAGVRDSDINPPPKIMLHLDNGWDWSLQEWFYSTVLGHGSLVLDDFDMMGVSFYPFYDQQATLSSLRTSLANMRSTWGKEVLVVETNWPTSCPSPQYPFPSDVANIPFSPDGQVSYVQSVADAVTSAGGVGLFYWEPAWVNNQALGSSCESNTMFEWPGTALSSLSVFSLL